MRMESSAQLAWAREAGTVLDNPWEAMVPSAVESFASWGRMEARMHRGSDSWGGWASGIAIMDVNILVMNTPSVDRLPVASGGKL